MAGLRKHIEGYYYVNNSNSQGRVEQRRDFTPDTRLRLAENDLDDIEKELQDEITAMKKTLTRISTACISIMTALVGSLILLVVQLAK